LTSVTVALAETIALFNSLPLRYVVGGSFASAAWGQYRFTQDIDVALLLAAAQVKELVGAAEPRFMIDRVEVEGTLRSTDEYRSFQMLHFETMFKVDCFVPFESETVRNEFNRAVRLELVPGVVAPCLSAEDIILRKLRWFEIGNRVSDRQWNDVVQVLEMQAGLLDEPYLNESARHHGVHDLLAMARQRLRP
jgi:hypothetical protein